MQTRSGLVSVDSGTRIIVESEGMTYAFEVGFIFFWRSARADEAHGLDYDACGNSFAAESLVQRKHVIH